MKVKTSKLTTTQLNWAVASIMFPGDTMIKDRVDLDFVDQSYPYCEDWSKSGPIIERERISLHWILGGAQIPGCWSAHIPGGNGRMFYGPTPLVAGTRCFVASRLGDEIDVPEELLS